MTTDQFDELIEEIIDEKNDRSLIILSSSIIDEQLYNILKKFLAPPKKANEEDFLKGDNPLSTFSSRIKATYRLGLISEEFKEVLDTVRKIRNLCAHSVDLNLHKSPIRDLISNLKRKLENRQTFILTKKRYYQENTHQLNELKLLLITVSVILEAICSSITKIEINKKTQQISTK